MLFSSLALILSLAGACAAPTPADATSTSAAPSSTSDSWVPPVNNKTAPAVTLPLANPPVFDKPNEDNWLILDTPASTTSPGTGTTISWSWGKDHVNGSLGAVALILTNANKSLLAEDALLIITDDSMSNTYDKDVLVGVRLNSPTYAVGANYTIKMVRDSNHSMVFAESKLFPIKPVGQVPAASGGAAMARSAGLATVCAALVAAAAAMVV
ncbi:uncharacterized protein EHS24_002450 [Apiotrichum porosum]|uniref:Uncharacterized protein n=1 Tax=Apiotrichum porosum TaxID=105984 RepID=A0A427XGH4_9TREE|nr:uncharacterized protein EHS24_002450 [Apiotrichum porosum]RSH77999.1 hypothetical protein EHS24_002450 [Apiotrichum porosum]